MAEESNYNSGEQLEEGGLGYEENMDMEAEGQMSSEPQGDFFDEPAEPEPQVVRHKESTLVIDSAMLQAVEEINGEIEVEGARTHRYVPIFSALIGVLIVVVILFIILTSPTETPQEDAAQLGASQEGAVAQEDSAPKYDPIPTIRGKVETDPVDTYISVNGVLGKLSQNKDGFNFLKHRPNVVTAYSEGYVPQTIFLPKDYSFDDPITIALENAELYQTGLVTIELEDKSYIDTNAKLNGKSVVLPTKVNLLRGVPNQLLIEREGHGSHLHVFYVYKDTTKIKVPSLTMKSSADRSTVVNLLLPKDLQKLEGHHSFKLDVHSNNEKHSNSGQFILSKGNYIYFDFEKLGRYPFKYVIDTTPFGSVTMEADMLVSSLGTADVRFNVDKAMKGVQVCFRRPGDLFCPEMKGISSTASGTWEVVAYREDHGYKKILTGTSKEELKNKMSYVFKVLPAGVDGFQIVQESAKKLR